MIHSGRHTLALARTVCGICLYAMLVDCGSDSAPPAAIAPPILLFNGTGTSPNDVAAIETLLRQNHLGYVRVNSEHLDAMTQSQIQAYRLLIIPGGNFVIMGNSLTAGASANVRNAVRGGLNYLGICAGGFLAGSFPPPYHNFNLTSGVQFGFYSAGARKAAVRIATAEGQALDQYWEDGPELSGWGATVATYPDGKPAVVEGFVGDGWVVLLGVHPEAPENWRRGMTFSTPASASNAYAVTLIDSALNGRQLAHY